MSESLASLVTAVSNGDVDTARNLLDAEPGLARQQQGGASPLHYAAIHGHRNAVDLLIDRGADMEDLDTEYRAAPIGWANEKGHMDLVRHLRARGTRVSLHMAAAFGFDDDVESLATAHPDHVNLLLGYGTPLHLAALWGHSSGRRAPAGTWRGSLMQESGWRAGGDDRASSGDVECLSNADRDSQIGAPRSWWAVSAARMCCARDGRAVVSKLLCPS